MPVMGIGTDDQLDVLSDEAPEHAFDVADDRVQRQYVRFHRLLPAEGHQLANQVRRPFASLLHFFDLGADGTTDGQFVQQHLAMSHDDGQQIVEIMGKSPGQAADGFHLLRLSQLLFAHP